MKRTMNRVLRIFFAVIVLIAPLCALAETWSTPFSADAIQSISAEETESILAHLEETSMGLDSDEMDYRYSYSIEGMIGLNGQSWYVGHWNQEFDDHVDLVTDFLLDIKTLEMYPCTYPAAGVIQWSSEYGMEDDIEQEGDFIGESYQLVPYMSADGYSLAYDAACLAPVDGYKDYFAAVTGEEGVAAWVLVVENIGPQDYDSYLLESTEGNEALFTQFKSADGALIKAVTFESFGMATHRYLVPFGDNALAFSCQAPVESDGVWGARFDMMAQSIAF